MTVSDEAKEREHCDKLWTTLLDHMAAEPAGRSGRIDRLMAERKAAFEAGYKDGTEDSAAVAAENIRLTQEADRLTKEVIRQRDNADTAFNAGRGHMKLELADLLNAVDRFRAEFERGMPEDQTSRERHAVVTLEAAMKRWRR